MVQPHFGSTTEQSVQRVQCELATERSCCMKISGSEEGGESVCIIFCRHCIFGTTKVKGMVGALPVGEGALWLCCIGCCRHCVGIEVGLVERRGFGGWKECGCGSIAKSDER